MSDKNLPKYAILSHTWGDEEITFEDWQAFSASSLNISDKEGFNKIDRCCRQAVEDGLEWVWVDTSVIVSTSTIQRANRH